MSSFNWRRRRGRGLPRQARLALSISALLLIILLIALIARGCSGQGDPTDGAPQATGTPQTQTAQPPDQPDEQSAENQTPDDTLSGEPEGSESAEDALQDVPDIEVDIEGDLSKTEPVPTAGAGNRSITIRSIGDIVCHTPIMKSVYNAADKSYDFSPLFQSIAPSMAAADYTVLNVDGPMPGKKFVNGYKGYPQFNTPPFILHALKDAGVDMLTLANNHALDTYFDGLKATLDNVDKVGLDHIGTYRTQEEYDAPYVKDIGGIKVGFLNYATGTNGMAKRSDPAASQYGLRMVSNSSAATDIAALRAAGAEAVVVYMHWGEEYLQEVTNSLKSTAQKLIAAGADVIVGGHQHVVLPCEYVSAKGEDGSDRTGLVLYGMGNFLSDQRTRYRDSGVIFQFTLQDNPESGKVEVTAPRYVPVYVHRTQDGSQYNYRVVACGDVIDKTPQDIGETVLKRIKQVWNEQKEIMASGPAEPMKH